MPLWKDAGARLSREAIYMHFPGYLQASGPGEWRTKPVGVIRAGDFKLLEFFEDERIELYNLKKDIGEKNNLASQMPEKAKDLRKKLAAWRDRVHAAMPRRKKDAAP